MTHPLIDAICHYIEDPNDPHGFHVLVMHLRLFGIEDSTTVDRINEVIDRFYPAIIHTTA